MATFNHHMSIDLNGLLRNYKRKKINIFEGEEGHLISDADARLYIQGCLSKGWKLIPMGGENICEGFDHFGGGCPGHEIKEK